MVAEFDACLQRQKAQKRQLIEEETARLRAVEEPLKQLDAFCADILHRCLTAAGFHRHHRGELRKKRKKVKKVVRTDDMLEDTKALILRAQDGDWPAMEELQQPSHAESPVLQQLQANAGALVSRAIEAQMQFLYEDNLVARQGLWKQIVTLRDQLQQEHPSRLESLLIGQLLAAWTAVNVIAEKAAPRDGRRFAEIEQYEKLQDRALNRLCKVARTLAQLRRQLSRHPQVIQIIDRQLNIT